MRDIASRCFVEVLHVKFRVCHWVAAAALEWILKYLIGVFLKVEFDKEPTEECHEPTKYSKTNHLLLVAGCFKIYTWIKFYPRLPAKRKWN